MDNLEQDLARVINHYSLENESNTPDFVLAQYLIGCLDAYNVALTDRARWYDRMDVPGRGSLPFDEAIEPMALGLPGGEPDEAPAELHHIYISTACHHNLHAECRRTCKFCSAQCLCPYCDHSVLEKTDEE